MKALVFFIIPMICFISCKKPYDPGIISSPGQYLVVEGFIENGTDTTTITLSYTVNLGTKVSLNPVTNAIVSIQGDQNTNYPLTETKNGKYFSAGLNLNSANKYRLSIKTTDNRQYYSDYVPVLNTPPIDSLYFTVGATGITVNSASHDPTNGTQYYRWDYGETWIIHSNYLSLYKSTGNDIIPRNFFDDDIYSCWQKDTSSTIVLNSSAKLKSPVILGNLITSINSASEKIGVEYSILVRQYALTPDGYNFWTKLKKNTEQLGSIFDAQPSEVSGNIHSVNNPAEPVIGYISAGTTSAKRLFILNKQLPSWVTTQVNTNCQIDSLLYVYIPPKPQYPIPVNQVAKYLYYNSPQTEFYALTPVNVIMDSTRTVLGYTASTTECVDCRVRGTNKRPIFWK